MMINLGSTLVLRSKFSARNFFKDLHDTDATVCQYIGELCRYLLATPPSEYDTSRSPTSPEFICAARTEG
jgi:fatty-acyl-CoA synthase